MISKDYSSKFNVPFSDLGIQYGNIKNDLHKAIDRVFERGQFILGEEVALLEQEFSRYCEMPFSVGVSSGTDALFLALLSLDIGPGDEVIVPTFTYIATANAVSYTGATPVFVDISPDSYCVDITAMQKAITKKTKAIIPVHLYGHTVAMNELLAFARQQRIAVIEDAAQAHGAVYKPLNKKCGAMAEIGCFSFYPSKNLGAYGDAGMVTVRDEHLFGRLLKLRDCGRSDKYTHEIIGYNARLDTLQAAMLRVKLQHLDSWNDMRRQAAATYNKLFRDWQGVITPVELGYARHVYHIYGIRVKERDKVVGHLKSKGIACLVHYPVPLHLQPAYRSLGYKSGDFPVAEGVAKEIISLPMFPFITVEQITSVVTTVKEALQ